MLILFACTSGSVSLGTDSSAHDAGLDSEGELETAPGETGEIADTGSDDPPLDAPAQATLECDGSISAERDTSCAFTLHWPNGELNHAGPANLHIRGRSSEGFPKHQFSLDLVDGAGESAPADLLGMGRESDWVLNGMWIDRAMFRNKLAFDLFRELGGSDDWAPESAYAELTIDGDYVGLYLLNETVDHDASRLAFADDDGTGSRFILHADEEGFYSAIQYGYWAIDYPPSSELSAGVRTGIMDRVADWEARVNGGGDPFEQMRLDSFVLFVLIEEFVKNNDGYYLSHRVWTSDDGYLHMVPWDLDLSLGQPSYNDNENPASWIAYRPAIVANPALRDDFRARFAERWKEARADLLATDAVIARMEAYRAVMGDAIDRNWERWDIESVEFGGYLYKVSSAEEEYERVAAWTAARLEWMDEAVADY